MGQLNSSQHFCIEDVSFDLFLAVAKHLSWKDRQAAFATCKALWCAQKGKEKERKRKERKRILKISDLSCHSLFTRLVLLLSLRHRSSHHTLSYRTRNDTKEAWQWRCQMLQIQDNVYFDLKQTAATSTAVKMAFFEHWPLRVRWAMEPRPVMLLPAHVRPSVPEPIASNASIRVCARFRPLPKQRTAQRSTPGNKENVEAQTDDGLEALASGAQGRDGQEGDDTGEGEGALEAIVPLHQRLQMIQRQHNCSPSQARRLLWGGNAEQPYDPWRRAAAVGGPRPSEDTSEPAAEGAAAHPSADEEPEHHALPSTVRTGVLAVRPETRDMLLCAAGAGLRRFVFDAVLDDRSEQKELYAAAAADVVKDFINGVNGCILMYGQTGSGKTFSMFGPDDHAAVQLQHVMSDAGIAPRALAEVAREVEKRRRRGMGIDMRLAYIEVYGNEVTDLLRGGQSVGAWHGVAARALAEDSASVGVFV